MDYDLRNLKSLATTIRVLSIDAVEKAKSGHPGLPMGAADYAAYLWAYTLRFNPKVPNWLNRDRFVLSAGHGSMLLYSLLHLFEYDLPLSELKNFRQWESKTPGHPEFKLTPGVETTTGPLGQGFANGVGIGLAGKLLAERYGHDLFNFRVFALVSDGDLMEGVSAEAASMAGHLRLGNLKYIYDDNEISIGGSTDVTFTESVPKRFESYGWYVQSVDGHNVQEFARALENSLAENSRPCLICARTTIGFGSPNKANTAEVHGAPLGPEEAKLTKEAFGWNNPEFFISEEVKAFIAERLKEKGLEYQSWQESFSKWKKDEPELAAGLTKQFSREVPTVLKSDLLKTFSEPKKDATRNLSGKAIQVIANHLPYFIGGSADLEPSTKTLIKESADIAPENFNARNIRFGVREHAMGAIANGLAYSECFIPYTATFLVFSDYMRPTIRLAALSHLQTLFIFTHESFWVGEDGPTHQPIEHLQSLRLIPNLYVFRPADGIEIAMCYLAALGLKERPSCLLFTRQDVPPLTRKSGFSEDEILKGAYIVSDQKEFQVNLVASGSEVWVAVDAAKLLESKGIKARVVSIPCVELFMEQPETYRQSIIPKKSKNVLIEAGVTTGWEKIVGCDALMLGIEHFGASAPGGVLAEKFGFTPEKVSIAIEKWM